MRITEVTTVVFRLPDIAPELSSALHPFDITFRDELRHPDDLEVVAA